MMLSRIDVLCCALPEIDTALLARYENLLSDEELTRLRSFRSSSGAKEFLVGRALLRTALAERVNCEPTQLHFSKNADGKPALSFPHSPWQFNLTHSHDWVALALCEGASIGIDVESYRRRNNLKGIAKRFFSEAENAQLDQCRESEWLDMFFAVWTLKEAHAKALGIGLPKILNCSSVAIDLNQLARDLSQSAMDLSGSTNNLSGSTINFTLSDAASTTNAIASWLFKFEDADKCEQACALAVVVHGGRFDTPTVQRSVPLQSHANFSLTPLARGYQSGNK